MAFSPTDFPCPVAPATNRWGILARSKTKVSFWIVFPSATGRSARESWNRGDLMTEYIETTSLFLFGTSIPTVPLPGIGAMIRIPSAERLSAMSSSRFLILLIRTPGAGTISYSVTVGPIVASIVSIRMPKFSSVVTIRFLFSTSSWSVTTTRFVWSSSSSIGGFR